MRKYVKIIFTYLLVVIVTKILSIKLDPSSLKDTVSKSENIEVGHNNEKLNKAQNSPINHNDYAHSFRNS